MKSYRGTVGKGKGITIQGETLADAMARAGYIPRTSATSGNMLVGTLSTGQRFRFTNTSIAKTHLVSYKKIMKNGDEHFDEN